jgi:hypothetical protein
MFHNLLTWSYIRHHSGELYQLHSPSCFALSFIFFDDNNIRATAAITHHSSHPPYRNLTFFAMAHVWIIMLVILTFFIRPVGPVPSPHATSALSTATYVRSTSQITQTATVDAIMSATTTTTPLLLDSGIASDSNLATTDLNITFHTTSLSTEGTEKKIEAVRHRIAKMYALVDHIEASSNGTRKNVCASFDTIRNRLLALDKKVSQVQKDMANSEGNE